MKNVKTASTGNRTGVSPVLLLHCSAGSGRQWDRLAALLDGRFRAIAPDLIGYGKSPAWSGSRPLTLADEAARAASSLPADGAPIHVVGHSYGGAVALRLAADQPRRVRSLTLIEPVAFHTLREGDTCDRALLWSVQAVASDVAAGALSGDYYRSMGRFVDYWNGKGAWMQAGPDARRKLSRHVPKLVLDFYASVNEEMLLDAYRERCSFPVTVVRGECSPRPTRRIAELLNERITRSRLVTVPGAGHMLPFTHADAVDTAVLEQVEGRAEGGRRAA